MAPKSKRTKRSSSSQGQSSSSQVPSSSSFEEYSTPSHLLEENDIIPLAKRDEMERWWAKEYASVQKSYSLFVEQKYYVNKFGFINILFKDPLPSYAIFMPTGCCKSIMALSLEFFFSYRIDEAERVKVRPLYSQVLSSDIVDNHEGKYYVLRLSFRDLPYKPEESFTVTLSKLLKSYAERNDLDLFNEPDVWTEMDSPFQVSSVLSWLHKKYGKRIVVIIDEVDHITNTYMYRDSSVAEENAMKIAINNFLTLLSPSLSRYPVIERVILFGIHRPHGVLKSRSWIILDLLSEDECSQFFMFSKCDVESILERYGWTEHYSAVEKHYGNYTHGYFCPASIVAFVTHNAEYLLYKYCRRSCDILSIDLKSAQGWLEPFIDKEIHEEYIDTNSSYFTRPLEKHLALYQYVFAGLLRMSWPDNNAVAGLYKLSAGNLENLNIIGFFLERLVKVHSQFQLVDRATRALEKCDFMSLSNIFDEIFMTFKPIELTTERSYQNPMKLFLRFIPGWKIPRTEMDEGNVNPRTGDSGRTDIRYLNTLLKYLFIFELKFVRATDVTANPTIIDHYIKVAFDQIVEKGYVLPSDEKAGYKKIVEIATVCHGKVITMKSRLHKPSAPKKKRT